MSPLASGLLAAAVWLAVVSSAAAGTGAKELAAGPGCGNSRLASAAANGSVVRRSAWPPIGLMAIKAETVLLCYSCSGKCERSDLKKVECNSKYVCFKQNLPDDKKVYDCADKDDVPKSAYTCSTDLCNSAPGRALAPAPLATVLLLLLRLLRGALV